MKKTAPQYSLKRMKLAHKKASSAARQAVAVKRAIKRVGL